MRRILFVTAIVGGIFLLAITIVLVNARHNPPKPKWMFVRTDRMLYLISPDGSDVKPLQTLGTGQLRVDVLPNSTNVFITNDPTDDWNDFYIIYRYNWLTDDLQALTAPDVSSWFKSFSPNNDWIYLQDNRGWYRIRLDGTDQQFLAAHYKFHELHSVSHDGMGLILSIYGNDTQELFYLSVTDHHIDNIFSARFPVSAYTFAQHGEHIAFIGTDDDGQNIYRMDEDGANLQDIGNNVSEDYLSLLWSPDGEWIVFNAWSANGFMDIFRVRPDGTHLRNLTASFPDHYLMEFSPNGDWIIYESRERYSTLYQMRLDGTAQQPISSEYQQFNQVTWSPDGRWLLYDAYLDGHEQLITYDFETDTTIQLISADSYFNHEQVAWSPDSAWIVYGHDGQLYRIRPDGTDNRRLTNFTYPPYFLGWSPTVDLPYDSTYFLMLSLLLSGGGSCVFFFGLRR